MNPTIKIDDKRINKRLHVIPGIRMYVYVLWE